MRQSGRHRRFGVQSRAIAAFALGAALVSGTLAVTTFQVVKGELLAQLTRNSERETFVDARLVKTELGSPSAKLSDGVATLPSTSDTHVFIYRHGIWFSNAASVSNTGISSALLRSVVHGVPVEQRVILDGAPAVVVGLPLPSIGIAFFEEHTLTNLVGTLDLLATVLATVAIATTIGGALAGWWAAHRLVRPLSMVTSVATEISGGALGRRLPDDPDLQPLVTSFNAMVESLQIRIERDSRFASDVSHELRSPLTTIGASVELLGAFRTRLPDAGSVALDMLDFEVGRFTTMVADLLEIARMDAGFAELDFIDTPVDALMHAIVTAYEGTVPVEVASDAEGLMVRCDNRRLRQVFQNLLDNARSHGGGAVCVHVARDGPWAVVSVDDAGPGVPPAEQERVFERFYRGAASGRRRSTSGTGLGLSLVAEHVHAHNGQVEISDRPGGGARFTVRIPCRPS